MPSNKHTHGKENRAKRTSKGLWLEIDFIRCAANGTNSSARQTSTNGAGEKGKSECASRDLVQMYDLFGSSSNYLVLHKTVE